MKKLAAVVCMVLFTLGCGGGTPAPIGPTLVPTTPTFTPTFNYPTEPEESPRIVTPGAFCEQVGTSGVSKAGVKMWCIRKVGEKTPRWRTK